MERLPSQKPNKDEVEKMVSEHSTENKPEQPSLADRLLAAKRRKRETNAEEFSTKKAERLTNGTPNWWERDDA